MTALLDHLRCERKFLPRGYSLSEVLACVRRHPAIFREVYPPRSVNNIYLDSPGLQDYFDHVNGIASRSKTRIRWYGPPSGRIAAPSLECKAKQGLVSGKRVEALPSLVLDGGIDHRFLNELMQRARLPERSRLDLEHRHAALVNRYHRHYFLSADGRFRLTVDAQIRFCRPESTGESAAYLSPAGFEVVIELKFAPEHAGQAETITDKFPFRVARCSKYVLGIERVHFA